MTQTDGSSTALTVVPPDPLDLSLSVDTSRLEAAMEAFHEFVGKLLKPDVHYGKVPGVKKSFLWQPGAEEIFRAFNCRPTYTTVRFDIDPEKQWVFYWRKCEAIHIDTGTVVGEADAVCTSEEFKKDGVVRDFAAVMNNALMKADKRAFVKCARTLGCASEFFTQDEDLITPVDSGGGGRPRSAGTGARQSTGPGATPADPETGEIKPVGYWEAGTDKDGKAVLRIMCKDHNWWFAREWGGRDGQPVTIKCMKKLGDNSYCQFQVPKQSKAAATTGVSPNAIGFDKAYLLKALGERYWSNGNTMKAGDLAPILGLTEGSDVRPSHVEAWLQKNPKETIDSLVKMAFLYHGGTVAEDDPPIDGEYTEDDDLPFE